MKNKTCPKCGSNKIMANVKVLDAVQWNSQKPLHAVILDIEETTNGPFSISDGISGHITAHICSECGFTELYTDKLERLYEFYKNKKT